MSADTKPFRVGISGSYGGLNLGDEAILQSIVNDGKTRHGMEHLTHHHANS